MKIRVSMQGAYMVMELEDGQARRMFWLEGKSSQEIRQNQI